MPAAVLWNGTVGLVPLGHVLPDGLTAVALAGLPPSRVVVAWSNDSPLIRSFVRIAAATYRAHTAISRGAGRALLR